MSEDARFWLILAAVSICALLAIRFLFSPLRILIKGALKTLFGMLGVLLFNLAGELLGITLGLNFVNGAVVGFLGLPGLALLLFSRWALM